MTANEFKKENHFRYTADRTCMNCKHMGESSKDEYGSEGHVIHTTYKCFYDKENPKHAFQVFNVSICDKWERNRS